ncbi:MULTISPECIES: RES family NAD+ phosphorylase [Bacillaceae]|uniref:RES family NAD+ phosphorylase n=1 Tax=Evansella alkalicola TaxID=745819 RepID=A0ABS6JXX6_9BACI|nr:MULTISPECIES: RES family NAD+ phosphorylase [Bacillaceae]MBU9723439.1 RES family NAD+ phosphorylase [Bacillus alkalicola]
MICCENCFRDIEIKAIIKGIQNTGDCEICFSTDVNIYNTNVNTELVDSFNELIEVYTPVDSLPDIFPREKLVMLKDELFEKWNIFNINKEKIYIVIKNICHEKYEETPEYFDSSIGILDLDNTDYLEANSLLKNYEWEDFVAEIKTNIRFHTNIINTEILNEFCESAKCFYKKGKIFYRGRLSTRKGFSKDEMGPPPDEKASDGRANPVGVSCLYLANDEKTTLHEIKAGLYDYVSIGTFELLEDIELIDFTIIDKVSPFLSNNLDFKQYIINKKHLSKISHNIAKPLRRNDSPLDYLPTQYIVDFIKSKGHSGIKYSSTMRKNGYNIAIFNKGLFECKEVRVHDVEMVNYESNPLGG